VFSVGWVRRVAFLNEFFVHHEDVRRANGSGQRTSPPGEDAALFRNVACARWFLSRWLCGAGLDLVWAGRDQASERSAARATDRSSCVGFPVDCSCSSSDGGTRADVEITGSPEAIEALQRTSFGM
jgi:hypothetical protein